MRFWHWFIIGAFILAFRTVSQLPPAAGPDYGGFDPGRLRRIAEAVAKAEGYGVPGAIPTTRNNPGNIRSAAGPIATYGTPEAGWQALYNQLSGMLDGSALYPPDWTIEQVAQRYTGEAAYMNWARIVAGELGVTTKYIFSELA